jgi:hypothetical protein
MDGLKACAKDVLIINGNDATRRYIIEHFSEHTILQPDYNAPDTGVLLNQLHTFIHTKGIMFYFDNLFKVVFIDSGEEFVSRFSLVHLKKLISETTNLQHVKLVIMCKKVLASKISKLFEQQINDTQTLDNDTSLKGIISKMLTQSPPNMKNIYHSISVDAHLIAYTFFTNKHNIVTDKENLKKICAVYSWTDILDNYATKSNDYFLFDISNLARCYTCVLSKDKTIHSNDFKNSNIAAITIRFYSSGSKMRPIEEQNWLSRKELLFGLATRFITMKKT